MRDSSCCQCARTILETDGCFWRSKQQAERRGRFCGTVLWEKPHFPSNNTGSSQKQGFGYWLCHAILYVTTSPVQPYRLEKADPRQSIVLSFITNSSSIIIINIINIIIIVMITIGNIVIVICCIVQTCMLVRR